MRVIYTETEVRLVPETDFDRAVAKRLMNCGTVSVQTDWDQQYVSLVFPVHPFDAKY